MDANHDITLRRFKFDFKTNPYPTIVAFAKRNTGKSWTGAGMMEHFSHIPRWYVWAGTGKTRMFWADLLGSEAATFGTDKHGLEQFKKIIAYQQKKIRYYMRKKEPVPECYGIGLIFDDVSSNRKFTKEQIMEDFFSNGRHYHALIYFSCQYVKQLPPAIRTNIDYIVMLKLNRPQLYIIFDEMIDALDDKEQFVTLVKNITSRRDKDGKKMYLAVVYDNFVNGDNMEDFIYVYKSRPGFKIEDVKLGSEEWRAYNQRNYVDPEAELEDKNERKKQRMLAAKEQRGLSTIDDVDDFDDDDIIKEKIQWRKGDSIVFNLDLRDPAESAESVGTLADPSQYSNSSMSNMSNSIGPSAVMSQYTNNSYVSQYTGVSHQPSLTSQGPSFSNSSSLYSLNIPMPPPHMASHYDQQHTDSFFTHPPSLVQTGVQDPSYTQLQTSVRKRIARRLPVA